MAVGSFREWTRRSPCYMKGIRLAQVLMLSSAFFLSCRQALAFSAKPAFARTAARFVHRLQVQVDREADYVEMVLGGERYSMVPLPDSMVSTTVVVKNLCEFVHDEDLSALFQKVSFLRSLPACVARKADMTSMQYGFVTFPSEDEKEAAIIRFNGLEWRGKFLKVESIRDDYSSRRVRVPERMVEYVSGIAKKTRSGKTNELRRISRDDVDRLSRGQPSKRKGYGSRNVPHRLNDEERMEMDRAAGKGFLVLTGAGNRRTRKGSPLRNIHRQWCDARAKPQVIVYKAIGGGALDQVIVDLSPLRLNGLFDDPGLVEEFLVKWKADILTVANHAGMKFQGVVDEDEGEEDSDNDMSVQYVATFGHEDYQLAWATNPIWKLPVVSMGVFEGERTRAKAMAKALALLWDIPETANDSEGHKAGPSTRLDAGARTGGRTKTKGLSQHRKRGGGHRQAWSL